MEGKEQFRKDAKQMVDSLFENKLLRPDLTRDDMNALEDWLNITMSWCLESHLKCRELLERIEKRENK